MMIEKKKYICLDGLLKICAIIFLIGLISIIVCKTPCYNGFYIDECHKMKEIFTVKWGNNEQSTTLPDMVDNPGMENIYISTVLHKENLGKGNSILFRNRQSCAKVYLDGVLVFDSGDAFNKPFPMGYGSFWKSIRLDDDYDGKTLTIELQPIYSIKAVSGYIPTIFWGTQASFIAMILKHVLWTLIPTLILIMVGLYDIVNGLFAIHKKKASQMFFLGLFAINTGTWMLVECHILELFISNMVCVVYLSYITYGMMPVLLIRYILSYDEFADKIYLKVICVAGAVMNLVQLLLAATGIYSQFESEWLNRSYLIITIIGLLLALFSVREIEKGAHKRMLYSGILIIVISAVLELLYFVFINKENSGNILRFGVCLFILKAGFDLVREGKQLRRDDFEKQILQNMAYTDGLTHLGNRFAFEQEKDRLEKLNDTRITVMVADMNGLKHVNDNYGHAYGDKIICKTAELLNDAFKNTGSCYRIGGDEFCILTENVSPDSFDKCINNMNKQIEDVRTKIEVYGLAYGRADGVSQDVEDVFRQADNRMYECKKKMKAGRE